MNHNAIYVRTPEQVPTEEHWAIIRGSSYTTEATGVWAPGHGYPASTEHYIEYTAYLNKAEFEAAVVDAFSDQFSNIRAIHVLPMTIKTTVTVGV